MPKEYEPLFLEPDIKNAFPASKIAAKPKFLDLPIANMEEEIPILEEELSEAPFFDYDFSDNITPESAKVAVGVLKELNAIDPKKEIVFHINTNGGGSYFSTGYLQADDAY